MNRQNRTIKEPVVILAGGKGMRMREYTDTLPKALVPIGPYPVIVHVMNIFAYYGYRRFILCVGYRGDAIKQYFMHHEWMTHDFTLKMGSSKTKRIKNHMSDFLDYEVTFVDTGLDTNTGGRIKKVEKYVQTDNFLVTYCDGLSDVNIGDLVKFHNRKGRIGTVTAVHPMSPFGVIDIEDDGVCASFREKPTLPGYINGGFFIFKREFFDYLDEKCVLEEEPLRKLAKEKQLIAYRHEGFWACMDTFKDVERLNTLWEKGYMLHTGFKGRPPWVHLQRSPYSQ